MYSSFEATLIEKIKVTSFLFKRFWIFFSDNQYCQLWFPYKNNSQIFATENKGNYKEFNKFHDYNADRDFKVCESDTPFFNWRFPWNYRVSQFEFDIVFVIELAL